MRLVTGNYFYKMYVEALVGFCNDVPHSTFTITMSTVQDVEYIKKIFIHCMQRSQCNCLVVQNFQLFKQHEQIEFYKNDRVF